MITYETTGSGSSSLDHGSRSRSSNASTDSDSTITCYSPNWVTFIPDIIIDAKQGLMWKVQLKLDSNFCKRYVHLNKIIIFLHQIIGSVWEIQFSLKIDLTKVPILSKRYGASKTSGIPAATLWIKDAATRCTFTLVYVRRIGSSISWNSICPYQQVYNKTIYSIKSPLEKNIGI